MSFKDRVKNDRLKIFLNLDFFGEIHLVEGEETIIMFDDEVLKEKQGGQDLAVAESSLLFYAASDDLPKKRVPGELLNIDGKEYIIDDWSEDMGMATVALRKNTKA